MSLFFFLKDKLDKLAVLAAAPYANQITVSSFDLEKEHEALRTIQAAVLQKVQGEAQSAMREQEANTGGMKSRNLIQKKFKASKWVIEPKQSARSGSSTCILQSFWG